VRRWGALWGSIMGRKRGRRAKQAPSQEWLARQAELIHPEQIAYEEVRPVVVLHQPIKEWAAQIGVSPRTLSRRVEQFIQHGIPGLVASQPRRPDDGRLLPQEVRHYLLQLKAEYPAFTPREIASILEVTFDRKVSHHTVERALARGPLPKLTRRRFPVYSRLPNVAARRDAILRLHLDGWSTPAIVDYLRAPRSTVYDFLQRWAEDAVVKRLGNKKPGRPPGGGKVTLPVVVTVKALQEESAIGAFRMAAALKQRYGIDLSPRTCGRIMAKNRDLYGIRVTLSAPRKPKKPMPFATHIPHRWWSVDLCYIEQHHVPNVAGPLYIWTILDNYSRCIVASAPSRTQTLWDFLTVLFTAIYAHGAPIGLVTDGGSVFRATVATELYAQLGIEKAQIQRRRPWQNFVESHFHTMKLMESYQLEAATSWEAFCAIHARFVGNFNHQAHVAHQEREDGLRTPAEVLGDAHGRQVAVPTLQQLFEMLLAQRTVDAQGYIRYHHWRVYGDEGLAGTQASVWLGKETRTLTLAYDGAPLAQYAVTFAAAEETADGERRRHRKRARRAAQRTRERARIESIQEAYRFPSPRPSFQLHLWDEEARNAIEWRKVYRLPAYAPRRLPSALAALQLPLLALPSATP
jgi:putative transposase